MMLSCAIGLTLPVLGGNEGKMGYVSRMGEVVLLVVVLLTKVAGAWWGTGALTAASLRWQQRQRLQAMGDPSGDWPPAPATRRTIRRDWLVRHHPRAA